MKIGIIALLVFLTSSFGVQAQTDNKKEKRLSEDCEKISSLINTMMEAKTVLCTPSKGKTGYTLILFSQDPLTGSDVTRSKFVFYALGAVGLVEGSRQDIGQDDYCLFDRASAAKNEAYCLPITRAVELQGALKAGSITPEYLLDRAFAEVRVWHPPK